jgi:hypothetical protein
VFIDLKKAFDIVDFEIIFKKLEHYGLPVQWFKSYLKNRKQYTFIDGESSTLLDILLGVPQGSILGPPLFIIFINNLPLATKLLTMLYADNTTFFNVDDSLENLFKTTN